MTSFVRVGLAVAVLAASSRVVLGAAAPIVQRGRATGPAGSIEASMIRQNLTVVSGTLTGTVRDRSRALVSGIEVVIRLETEANVAPHRTLTDQEGRFRFTGLPLGKYCLSTTEPGAGPTIRRGIQVRGAQDTNVPIVLGERPSPTPAERPRRRPCV